MNEQIADQSLNQRPNPKKSWEVRLGLLGGALLVSLALGSAGLNHLVPKLPDGAQGTPARLSWYLQHGQLQADLHTLSAAIQYIAASDSDTSAAANNPSLPVAGTAAPTLPKS
jgi:hypothetical protein